MQNIIEKYEETCKSYKNKKAIIFKDENISYGNLLLRTKEIGSYLTNFVNNNEPVIVFMNKGIIAVESFLGVIYSGGCYSLVNPDFPRDRILQIRDILNCRIILTTNETFELANDVFDNCNIIKIEDIEGKIDEEKLNSIKNNKLDIDPVYINFTSGSTGIPKGVVVSNKSIIDFIDEFIKLFEINENDIVANQAPFDFDVSVKDIYSCIFTGASLLIVPKEYFSNPSLLLDYITDNGATTLIWAVSALCLITTFHGLDYKVPKDVNKVIFSGEVMPLKHLNMWMNKLKDAKFINVYGPTEITCNCTYHIIDRKREYIDSIPIGRSFKNEKVFLLDDNNNLVKKVNELGEICVSGTCLSLGYYNNPEQNTKYFCQNPLNEMYYERIYRTGDFAKYNENYELVFCGRKDYQIKHMGHRIELEGIDKELMKIDGVNRTCTIFDEEKSKLYGFYVGAIDSKDLRQILTKHLPIYMIPNKLIQVEMFPLTKNGKIDRKKILSESKVTKNAV